jgi:hypothetical protein
LTESPGRQTLEQNPRPLEQVFPSGAEVKSRGLVQPAGHVGLESFQSLQVGEIVRRSKLKGLLDSRKDFLKLGWIHEKEKSEKIGQLFEFIGNKILAAGQEEK